MREHYCAIVGLGGMGNWHRELIKGEGSWNDRACGPIEHLHLAGSFDIRGERQAYARSVGLHTYGCLEELLSDEKVDIVCAQRRMTYTKKSFCVRWKRGRMLCAKSRRH